MRWGLIPYWAKDIKREYPATSGAPIAANRRSTRSPPVPASQSRNWSRDWQIHGLMGSEEVGTPHADEVGVFPTGRFEEAFRLEVHIHSVDVEMGGHLPFGVEVRLRAEKTLVVG
jgi:hypothetical protein